MYFSLNALRRTSWTAAKIKGEHSDWGLLFKLTFIRRPAANVPFDGHCLTSCANSRLAVRIFKRKSDVKWWKYRSLCCSLMLMARRLYGRRVNNILWQMICVNSTDWEYSIGRAWPISVHSPTNIGRRTRAHFIFTLGWLFYDDSSDCHGAEGKNRPMLDEKETL